MAIEQLKSTFHPWMENAMEQITKVFLLDCDVETLQYLHKNIEREISNVYKHPNRDNKDIRIRTNMLYSALIYFYNHFCWKLVHQSECPNVELSSVKLLSQIIKTGLILSKGNSESIWINKVLMAIQLFKGKPILIYEALLLVCLLKPRYHRNYAKILKHILTKQNQECINDPLVYMEIILLYRRYKSLMKTKLAKSEATSWASKVKPPKNLMSWFSSLDLGVFRLKYKSITKQIMKDDFNENMLRKIRDLAVCRYSFERENTRSQYTESTTNKTQPMFLIDSFSNNANNYVPFVNKESSSECVVIESIKPPCASVSETNAEECSKSFTPKKQKLKLKMQTKRSNKEKMHEKCNEISNNIEPEIDVITLSDSDSGLLISIKSKNNRVSETVSISKTFEKAENENISSYVAETSSTTKNRKRKTGVKNSSADHETEENNTFPSCSSKICMTKNVTTNKISASKSSPSSENKNISVPKVEINTPSKKKKSVRKNKKSKIDNAINATTLCSISMPSCSTSDANLASKYGPNNSSPQESEGSFNSHKNLFLNISPENESYFNSVEKIDNSKNKRTKHLKLSKFGCVVDTTHNIMSSGKNMGSENETFKTEEMFFSESVLQNESISTAIGKVKKSKNKKKFKVAEQFSCDHDVNKDNIKLHDGNEIPSSTNKCVAECETGHSSLQESKDSSNSDEMFFVDRASQNQDKVCLKDYDESVRNFNEKLKAFQANELKKVSQKYEKLLNELKGKRKSFEDKGTQKDISPAKIKKVEVPKQENSTHTIDNKMSISENSLLANNQLENIYSPQLSKTVYSNENIESKNSEYENNILVSDASFTMKMNSDKGTLSANGIKMLSSFPLKNYLQENPEKSFVNSADNVEKFSEIHGSEVFEHESSKQINLGEETLVHNSSEILSNFTIINDKQCSPEKNYTSSAAKSDKMFLEKDVPDKIKNMDDIENERLCFPDPNVDAKTPLQIPLDTFSFIKIESAQSVIINENFSLNSDIATEKSIEPNTFNEKNESVPKDSDILNLCTPDERITETNFLTKHFEEETGKVSKHENLEKTEEVVINELLSEKFSKENLLRKEITATKLTNELDKENQTNLTVSKSPDVCKVSVFTKTIKDCEISNWSINQLENLKHDESITSEMKKPNTESPSKDSVLSNLLEFAQVATENDMLNKSKHQYLESDNAVIYDTEPHSGDSSKQNGILSNSTKLENIESSVMHENNVQNLETTSKGNEIPTNSMLKNTEASNSVPHKYCIPQSKDFQQIGTLNINKLKNIEASNSATQEDKRSHVDSSNSVIQESATHLKDNSLQSEMLNDSELENIDSSNSVAQEDAKQDNSLQRDMLNDSELENFDSSNSVTQGTTNLDDNSLQSEMSNDSEIENSDSSYSISLQSEMLNDSNSSDTVTHLENNSLQSEMLSELENIDSSNSVIQESTTHLEDNSPQSEMLNDSELENIDSSNSLTQDTTNLDDSSLQSEMPIDSEIENIDSSNSVAQKDTAYFDNNSLQSEMLNDSIDSSDAVTHLEDNSFQSEMLSELENIDSSNSVIQESTAHLENNSLQSEMLNDSELENIVSQDTTNLTDNSLQSEMLNDSKLESIDSSNSVIQINNMPSVEDSSNKTEILNDSKMEHYDSSDYVTQDENAMYGEDTSHQNKMLKNSELKNNSSNSVSHKEKILHLDDCSNQNNILSNSKLKNNGSNDFVTLEDIVPHLEDNFNQNKVPNHSVLENNKTDHSMSHINDQSHNSEKQLIETVKTISNNKLESKDIIGKSNQSPQIEKKPLMPVSPKSVPCELKNKNKQDTLEVNKLYSDYNLIGCNESGGRNEIKTIDSTTEPCCLEQENKASLNNVQKSTAISDLPSYDIEKSVLLEKLIVKSQIPDNHKSSLQNYMSDGNESDKSVLKDANVDYFANELNVVKVTKCISNETQKCLDANSLKIDDVIAKKSNEIKTCVVDNQSEKLDPKSVLYDVLCSNQNSTSIEEISTSENTTAITMEDNLPSVTSENNESEAKVSNLNRSLSFTELEKISLSETTMVVSVPSKPENCNSEATSILNEVELICNEPENCKSEISSLDKLVVNDYANCASISDVPNNPQNNCEFVKSGDTNMLSNCSSFSSDQDVKMEQRSFPEPASLDESNLLTRSNSSESVDVYNVIDDNELESSYLDGDKSKSTFKRKPSSVDKSEFNNSIDDKEIDLCYSDDSIKGKPTESVLKAELDSVDNTECNNEEIRLESGYVDNDNKDELLTEGKQSSIDKIECNNDEIEFDSSFVDDNNKDELPIESKLSSSVDNIEYKSVRIPPGNPIVDDSTSKLSSQSNSEMKIYVSDESQNKQFVTNTNNLKTLSMAIEIQDKQLKDIRSSNLSKFCIEKGLSNNTSQDLGVYRSELFLSDLKKNNFLTFSDISSKNKSRSFSVDSGLKNANQIEHYSFSASTEIFSSYRDDVFSTEDKVIEPVSKNGASSYTHSFSDDGKSRDMSSEEEESEQEILDVGLECYPEMSEIDTPSTPLDSPLKISEKSSHVENSIDISSLSANEMNSPTCVDNTLHSLTRLPLKLRHSLRLRSKADIKSLTEEDPLVEEPTCDSSQNKTEFPENETHKTHQDSELNINEPETKDLNPICAAEKLNELPGSTQMLIKKVPKKSMSQKSATKVSQTAPKRYSLRQKKSNQHTDDSSKLGIDIAQLHLDSPSKKVCKDVPKAEDIILAKLKVLEAGLSSDDKELLLSAKRGRISVAKDVKEDPTTSTPSYNLRTRKSILAPERFHI